jgi:hypothetical protein
VLVPVVGAHPLEDEVIGRQGVQGRNREGRQLEGIQEEGI